VTVGFPGRVCRQLRIIPRRGDSLRRRSWISSLIVGERPPTLFCADVNGNEREGLTRVDLEMRDEGSGELVPASIIVDALWRL
jgi:hypothetical protein